jgi:dCTP deaminase
LSEKDFRVFSNMTNQYIDPKRLCSNAFTKAELQHDEHTGEAYFWMPPLSYALGVSMEYFFMPDNVIAICLGKSTYARAGLLVNVTPLEAGWHGEVTLEFCNPTPMPMRVYANEGICQFLFLRGERPQTTYAERQGGAGKYQGQRGITLPRV